MPHHLAIVSYFSTGAYDSNTVDEDKILSTSLSEQQISHEIVSWSDPNVQWEKFSLLLIKSTWDYFDHYSDFLAWIATIKALGIPTLNDLDTIIWNSSKRYLREIEEKGFPVIKGAVLEVGKQIDSSLIEQYMGTGTCVVKPLVSGGAKNTFKINASEWESFAGQIQALVDKEDFLIQPYVKEITEIGEYSLIFFNGEFSHAVLKSPASDDFRVQHYFGGTIKTIDPDSEMLLSAAKLVAEFAPESLYARVDGVKIDGVFHLMELELIEPYLFLALSDKGLECYKKALSQRLSQMHTSL